ncbi:hypothetical protein [Pantoea sp. 1.19]|uniref:hypothetical protein n=1 Tax=Pantoea sp. 1.19 TaxID=1925589 RepID=UPI000948E433|nr:hypothetical protein [Pantoea sp. 1.19]
MINIKPIFLLLLFFTSAAGAAPTATKCQYYTKGWLGIKTYSDATLQASRTLGAQDIRRSWTPGTVIETETRTDPVNFGSYEGLTCGKSAQIISRITNGALLPDIRVPGVDNSDGKVHSTNVPGIGVLVKFKLSGGAYDAFFFRQRLTPPI